MRHPGTKDSRPAAVHGYGWYDRDTGQIDLCRLATEATRDAAQALFATPPAWVMRDDIPSELPDASPTDLARLEARARRAFVHAR